MQSSWQGLYPALWTPTNAAGILMKDALADQVRFLRAAGADGVLALGSTGEFVHLDITERKAGLQIVVESASGWPVIANCSEINPRRVAELGRHAREVGAAAISLLPPWFFSPTPADVVEFLVRGAEASRLPLMLYNFPERTGNRLGIETVADVCDRVPVVAVKQSGAEFDYHRELASLGLTKGFTVITGADLMMPEAFELGARGVVSGQANAVPELVVAVWRAVAGGEAARASKEDAVLREFARATGGLEFPLNVAAGMQARGRPTGDSKPVLSGATRLQLARAVSEARAVLERVGLGA